MSSVGLWQAPGGGGASLIVSLERDPMSFDRLAPHYGWMETLLAARKLQRCRTAFLSRTLEARNVLILGEGNGRFLAECRQRLKSARITCIDASSGMLDQSRKRLSRLGLSVDRVDFMRADVLQWAAPQRVFDLIVTHFFLDCFRADQLPRLVSVLAEAARPGAAWLIADFQVPDAGFGRWRALLIHRVMYVFFRWAAALPARRLTSPDPFFRSCGFVLRERQISDWGLLRSDFWERIT
jgi:ubiquinone/menaquinone biosynthesis C-methylase UbiE